jgi:RNA polymerase sigma-70 factor (ECF subfamily)
MTDDSPSDRSGPMGVSALQRAEARQSDKELAALVLSGDEAAFRQLYRRHTPRLMALVLRFLGGNEADAEDVVQEAWVRAAERLDQFRWEAAFASWLSSIALNLAREQLRRHGRRKEVEWPEGPEEPPAVAPLSRVDTADLERAIAGLPTGYRTVLVLHDVEGYRHEEIADLLGVSVGTSKSQLFHARRAVRTELGASMGKGLTDA